MNPMCGTNIPPMRTTVAGDWVSIYTATLDNLRSKWPHDWPGLPLVLQSCVQELWPADPTLVSQAHPMLKAARAMAQHMEDMAQQTDFEPHYHNRLHTADALCAACLLMQCLQTQGHDLSDDWKAAVLLAVTSHDVLHPGGANGFLQEFEHRSAIEMQHIARGLSIAPLWLERVSALILRTDPSLVAGNHDKVKHQSFHMNLDWACVLINEADILASAMPSHGMALGHALAAEWAVTNHPLHAVVGTAHGRLGFLASLRFSTPASEAFQMRALVSTQMAQLG